jgi:hypothetical protein
MDRSFTLLNGWVTTCSMVVHHRLSCADCDCKGASTSTICTKYNVELEYADVCQMLDFDPRLPLFVVGTPNVIVPVEFPQKKEGQTDYPNQDDYPTDDDHFAWVNKMAPVVRIPVHSNQPDTVVLTQSATGGDVRPKTTLKVIPQETNILTQTTHAPHSA